MKKTYPDLVSPHLKGILREDETRQATGGTKPAECSEPDVPIGETVQDRGRKADPECSHETQPVLRADPSLRPAQKAAVRLYGWMQALVSALLLVLLIFLFAVKIIGIEGSSMLPTLRNGDYVLATAGLLSPPKQGDVVVLRKNSFMSDPIVKRVIATAGQTVDINFETGAVRVDGKLLNEPYILEKTKTMYDVSFPVKVPEGCIFVLGDNRNRSTDSRYSGVGMVDDRYILGKVLMILAPPGRIGAIR